MKSIISKLNVVKEALLKVSENVGHYEAFKQEDQYIVWAESGEGGSLEADDKKEHQPIQGTIDYFTKTDMDPQIDEIQEMLRQSCISFYLNSVQYEEETGFIHYEWVFEVT